MALRVPRPLYYTFHVLLAVTEYVEMLERAPGGKIEGFVALAKGLRNHDLCSTKICLKGRGNE